MEVKYRNESYSGSGIRNAVDVIVHEIYELRNTDIIDYCLSHFSLQKMHFNLTFKVLKDTIEDNDAVEESDIRILIEDLLKNIESETGISVNYALWLATKESVKENYDGEESTIDAYEIGPVILSDLGEDGVLYGYQTKPVKIG